MSQIPTLRTHIWQVRSGHIYPNSPQWFHRFLLWEFIFGRPGLGRSNSSLECSFYRFLLWEFIFGRPGLGRSTPSLSVSNDNFTDSYSESSSLAGQIFLDLPLSPTGISQIPTLRAHIWQTRSWQILQPSPYSDFTNSYSDSLYLADQVLRSWQIYPLKWQFHRSLIWGLIFGRPGLGRSSILPPNNDFTDSYSESSYLAGQVWTYLPHPPQWFHRFLLWELIFGRPGHRRSILSNGNVKDCYSEDSYLGDQVLGDLSSQMAMSQIPTLRTHILQVRSGHIYPNPPQWL